MEAHVVAARDFVTHLDRALSVRRLYSDGSGPFREAMELLWTRFQVDTEKGDITLVLGPAEILCDDQVVLSKKNRDDAFHFALYRDGLRELRISSETPREELDRFVEVFEADRRGLVDSTEDTVGFLWRCDLQHITYSAIDGIGDVESEEGELQGLVGNDFQSLVAALTSRVKSAPSPVTGQSYAFVLDADVQLPESDLHYDAETERVAFDRQPVVFKLTPEEARKLREEAGEETEPEKLDRFVEILFAILTDPESTIPGRKLIPVLQRLLDGYWNADDEVALERILYRLSQASSSAPAGEKRETALRVLTEFLGRERLLETLDRLTAGELSPDTAHALWSHSGAEGWSLLFAVWARGNRPEVQDELEEHLRKRLVDQPELLRRCFREGEAQQVVAALELVGARSILMYAEDVLNLAQHGEESVRLKAVAMSDRIGGPEAERVLWHAVEGDESTAVRMVALRRLVEMNAESAVPRLLSLVVREGFRKRPMVERVRLVRVLGELGGAEAEKVFLSWIPQKWLWKSRDLERAELALRGLMSSGQSGLEMVRSLTTSRTPASKIARKLLVEKPVEKDEDTAALEALAAEESSR